MLERFKHKFANRERPKPKSRRTTLSTELKDTKVLIIYEICLTKKQERIYQCKLQSPRAGDGNKFLLVS